MYVITLDVYVKLNNSLRGGQENKYFYTNREFHGRRSALYLFVRGSNLKAG